MAGWIEVLGSVATQADLPEVETVDEGQGYIVRTNNHLWTVEGGVWVDTGITSTPDGTNDPVTTGLALGELVDVVTAGAEDGQALVYDVDLGLWGPGSVAASGISGGVSSLDELDDVDTSGVVDGDLLAFVGTEWVPQAPSAAGAPAFDELTDVDTTGVVENDQLAFDGEQWVPFTPTFPTLDELTDVTITDPVTGDVITYDEDTGTWITTTPTPDPVAVTDLTDVDLTGVQPVDVLIYGEDGLWRPSTSAVQLNSLTDVSTAGALDGWFITYDETEGGWLASAPASAVPQSMTALVDVDLVTLTEGDTLVYDSIAEEWIPRHFETFVVSSTEPDVEDNQLWLDTDDNSFWVWDGAEWVQVGGLGQDLLHLISNAAQSEDIAAIEADIADINSQLDNALDLTDLPTADPILDGSIFLLDQADTLTAASGLSVAQWLSTHTTIVEAVQDQIGTKVIADAAGLGTLVTYDDTPGTTSIKKQSKPMYVWRSTSQSIPDDTWTDVTFDSEGTDTLNMWASGAPTLFVPPATATYGSQDFWFDITVPWASNTIGYRGVRLMQSFTSLGGAFLPVIPAQLVPAMILYDTDLQASKASGRIGTGAMDTSERWKVQVYQSSGGALNIVQDTLIFPAVGVFHLGASA